MEVALSVLLLGDRWPLEPAVIATYWSGICDQYCLYRENFKYKLHRISVGEDKSPVWWRFPSTSPAVTMEHREGTGDSPARATSSISAKNQAAFPIPWCSEQVWPRGNTHSMTLSVWDGAGIVENQHRARVPSAAPTQNSNIPLSSSQRAARFPCKSYMDIPSGNIPF